MNAGVPMILSAAVAATCPSATARRDFTMPKSRTFTKSCSRPMRQRWMFAGLTSRCTSPWACASARDAHLAQHVHRAGRRDRAEPLHQRLEVDSVQELHYEIERAVVGLPEIVQLDRV